MTPALRTAYWHDPQARQSFKDFILRIHGVDFSDWEAAGYWDEDYSPYSHFAGDRLVASLCIYTMPAVVNGEACTVAQVSGVGTLPEYRLQGLNRRLHEIALADTWAGRAAIEKLDLGERAVRESTYRLACARLPVSRVFATMNSRLVMYHLRYRLRDRVWRIPSIDAVVLMKFDGGRAVVHDILARKRPRFGQLAPFLAAGGAREVEFRFPVDQLQVPDFRLRELAGENVHVMGAFDLGPRPVFAFTSQA